jgi:hypothetical protein
MAFTHQSLALRDIKFPLNPIRESKKEKVFIFGCNIENDTKHLTIGISTLQ